jgi:hypothetical protein
MNDLRHTLTPTRLVRIRTCCLRPLARAAERNDDDDDELMGEWQDVVAQEPQSSLLGAQLAQMAVAVMAQHQVSVKTPLRSHCPRLARIAGQ